MCFTFIRTLFRRSKRINEDLGNLQLSQVQTDPTDVSESVETEYIIVDEREAMAAMGLPTAFGDKRKNIRKKRKARIGKEDFAKFVLPSLKECYGVQNLDSAASIMQKMGYFYSHTVPKPTKENEESFEIGKIHSEAVEAKGQDENVEVADSAELEIHDLPKSSEAQIEHDEHTDGEIHDRLTSVVNAELFDKDAQQTEKVDSEFGRSEIVDESGSSEYASAKSQVEDENNKSVNLENKVKKKRKSAKRSYPKEISEDKRLMKYFLKRYTLFSLYDYGIKMDREAWFSATPESIAEHTAKRLRCDVIVDAFCGTGGNAIQFAKTCNKVIAIDIDPIKIEMAKHNASIYEVSDKIDFIIGDFIQLSGTLKADAVFLSPPWGGPNYKANTVYDLEKDLQPVPLSSLFKLTKEITDNIAMYLPRNSNTQQLLVLAGAGNQVELERNYLFGRLTAITAYYGCLLQPAAPVNTQ